ncbi:MAG: ABC transporter ATP-binding protein [Deltaproteobacteria bacterium]|nr:ABC transporter ATP-binding protein [Deltaproteobacteria bacterium]
MPLLQVKRVSFRYGDQWTLRDISIDVAAGDIVGLIGPNGSGKTTLLKIIDGILNPASGEIMIEGMKASAMKRHDLARVIAVVPQDFPMIFPFSVEEIVLMGRSPHLGRLSFESKSDINIAHEAMKLTNTLHLAQRKFNALSGGERQRVLIARALAQEPRIILLDEFSAHLDMRHHIALFDLIKTLNKSRNLTAVIATHDINTISQYAGKIVMLHEGIIHAIGAPDAVITRENISTVYETNVLIDKHPKTGTPRLTLSSNLM